MCCKCYFFALQALGLYIFSAWGASVTAHLEYFLLCKTIRQNHFSFLVSWLTMLTNQDGEFLLWILVLWAYCCAFLEQANTHIHANPELKDVKVWQVHTLMKGLEKIASSASIPMLVAGDFNAVPGRFAYYFCLSPTSCVKCVCNSLKKQTYK